MLRLPSRTGAPEVSSPKRRATEERTLSGSSFSPSIAEVVSASCVSESRIWGCSPSRPIASALPSRIPWAFLAIANCAWLPDAELAVYAAEYERTGYQVLALRAEEFTADGFFKTGDVGRVDARGYVTIVGRSKDLIISGGYNVYPAEIEGYINDMPGVAESAVVGVPDADFGEVGVAVIVAKPGEAPDPARILRELKALGWKLDLILNTHWHPDHAGGNAAITAETSSRARSTCASSLAMASR